MVDQEADLQLFVLCLKTDRDSAVPTASPSTEEQRSLDAYFPGSWRDS